MADEELSGSNSAVDKFSGSLNLTRARLNTKPSRPTPAAGKGWLRYSFAFDLPSRAFDLDDDTPSQIEPEYYYWKWNETDTSQFTRVDGDANLLMGSFKGTAGGGVMPCLVMSGTKVNSHALWLINDMPELPRRYFIYALFYVGRDTAAGSGPGIVPLYQNSNFWIAYSQGLNAASNAINSVKNENGTRFIHSSSFTVPSFNHSGSRAVITILHTDTTPPGFNMVGSTPFQGNSVGTTVVDLIWGSGANALNGAWDFSSLDNQGKVGIVFNPISSSNVNVTGSNQFQLAKLIVFKHPMDWTNT